MRTQPSVAVQNNGIYNTKYCRRRMPSDTIIITNSDWWSFFIERGPSCPDDWRPSRWGRMKTNHQQQSPNDDKSIVWGPRRENQSRHTVWHNVRELLAPLCQCMFPPSDVDKIGTRGIYEGPLAEGGQTELHYKSWSAICSWIQIITTNQECLFNTPPQHRND